MYNFNENTNLLIKNENYLISRNSCTENLQNNLPYKIYQFFVRLKK